MNISIQSVPTAAAAPTYVGVQILRGVAAMLVVLCHSSQMLHHRLGMGDVLFFGASGVDVFFPISGFVMAVTTYKYWGEAGHAIDFLVRRLIRIVPLYWAATTLKVAAIVAFPSVVATASLDAWHITASYLFIPAFDSDGKPFPVVPIGWTLNFEMFFYLLFAVVLALRLRPVLWLGGILLAINLLPPMPALGALGSLASSMLLEFVAGMLIGWATVKGYTLSRVWGAVILVAAMAALVLTQTLGEQTAFGWRLLVWGVPGALALAGALGAEPLCKAWARRWPEKLGDASYAIYLSHGFFLPVLGVLCGKMGLTSDTLRWPLLLGSCIASAWIGWFVHRWVEQPATQWLIKKRKNFDRSSRAPN